MSGRTHMSTAGGSYVDRIILNEDYDPARNDYDVALMRLSSPISVGGQRESLLTLTMKCPSRVKRRWFSHICQSVLLNHNEVCVLSLALVIWAHRRA